jgi:hypothetical protein
MMKKLIKSKGTFAKKKAHPTQSSMDLGKVRKLRSAGFLKDIRTEKDAIEMKREYERLGYHVDKRTYVVAGQRWWRLTLKI